jgi:hypothetical protein
MTSLKSAGDLQVWLESEACARLLTFLKCISTAMKGRPQSAIDAIEIDDEKERALLVRNCCFFEVTFLYNIECFA